MKTTQLIEKQWHANYCCTLDIYEISNKPVSKFDSDETWEVIKIGTYEICKQTVESHMNWIDMCIEQQADVDSDNDTDKNSGV